MIKRCTTQEGVVTFNISFQGLRPHKSVSQDDRDCDQIHSGYSSPKSLPMTPMNMNTNLSRSRFLKYTGYSDADSNDADGTPRSAGLCEKFFQSMTINDENTTKNTTDDFLTQDPIDFDELQKFIKQSNDDEDKDSVSTLSKSSKKIAKGKVGYVYKESRFKEEAKNKGKRQPWQSHEDEKVLELVAIHGQSWALIASIMGGRTGKQIRDRYLNNLRPDIKNVEWTRKEDQHLISLFKQIGRKWSKIATLMPGRTEGQVKNRFYSYIQKKILPKQSGETGTSPEGEISPSSRAEGTMNEEAANSLRQSYHSQFVDQPDFDNLRYSHVTSNGEQAGYGEFDFPEDLNLDQVTDYYAFEQNLTESYFSNAVADPTDVISYDMMEVPKVINLSPEKYFSRHAFTFHHENEMDNVQEMKCNSPQESCPDNMSISDLAHEFRLHCHTNEKENEVPFENLNCNRTSQAMVYEFSGIGIKPVLSNNRIFRQAIHNSVQGK